MFQVYVFLLFLFGSSALYAEQNGLDRLMEGNKRFVQGLVKHPNQSVERRQELVGSQEPFAVIVGCSDSRVAPEIVFDQGVGDLFVVRVAGNVIGPLELDSIEFAALYLRSSVVLVLGHENCGAVQAVINGTTKDIESVAELIEPAVAFARTLDTKNLLEASIKANAMHMRDYLLHRPVIQKLVEEQKLKVHAGYFNLNTGAVEVIQ